MRRATATLLTLAAIATAAPTLAAETAYGSGVGKAQAVKVSELMGNPDRYVGKAVRVEGLVTDVCARRGCWMELASDKEFQTIKIKVDDGVIVFPLDAKGKVATAEGVFTRIDVPVERVAEMKRHEAEEKGVPFDPGSVKGPEVVYRIQGTGAVIR
ncbi:MAG: hypothetical protein H6Q88_2162 [Anaeromyxobacteraceae bacterium]|jgi:hypothetical protein|nr:hypothetical protein [Anaeromyxobacteraceae bacterium]